MFTLRLFAKSVGWLPWHCQKTHIKSNSKFQRGIPCCANAAAKRKVVQSQEISATQILGMLNHEQKTTER
jgi:hypothetical protein